MGSSTKIEWCDHTFSPWWGCVNVSPACDHCYADSFSRRVGFSETGSKFPIWGKNARRRFFGDKHWSEPLKWNRAAQKEGVRKRVFCGSMCDVMEDRADLQELRERLYALIEATPYLDWLLLTKRPQNFGRFLPISWMTDPRPNVWGMTTVESNAYRWRIDQLIETPFAIRGLSCEPLLEDLQISQALFTGKIHWVIIGGESGPGARPMHPQWARSLRDQCQAAGVNLLFKQWGSWIPRGPESMGYPVIEGSKTLRLTDQGQNDSILGAEGGHAVWMQRLRKKSEYALLDGVEWKQFPA